MLKVIPREYFDPSKGTLKLLWEEEWRALGITQSLGWEHYEVHEPEPHILLFKSVLRPVHPVHQLIILQETYQLPTPSISPTLADFCISEKTTLGGAIHSSQRFVGRTLYEHYEVTRSKSYDDWKAVYHCHVELVDAEQLQYSRAWLKQLSAGCSPLQYSAFLHSLIP